MVNRLIEKAQQAVSALQSAEGQSDVVIHQRISDALPLIISMSGGLRCPRANPHVAPANAAEADSYRQLIQESRLWISKFERVLHERDKQAMVSTHRHLMEILSAEPKTFQQILDACPGQDADLLDQTLGTLIEAGLIDYHDAVEGGQDVRRGYTTADGMMIYREVFRRKKASPTDPDSQDW